jgi:hypothetical protein
MNKDDVTRYRYIALVGLRIQINSRMREIAGIVSDLLRGKIDDELIARN